MTSEFSAFLKDISGIGRPTIPTRVASELLADFMGWVAEPYCVNTVIVKVDSKIGINASMLKTGFGPPMRLYPQNMGAHLSIDETSLSNGELVIYDCDQ